MLSTDRPWARHACLNAARALVGSLHERNRFVVVTGIWPERAERMCLNAAEEAKAVSYYSRD
jgi:hypothetical protein